MGYNKRKMKKVFEFLRRLEKNNNREWFAEHKGEYQDVKQIIDLKAQEFIDLVASIDPRASVFTPKDVTYRIYRDTRFSHNKDPYKSHVGIFVCPPFGKKSLFSGYYLHLEPGNSFIGGGNYGLPSSLLRALRKDIYDNIEEYLSIVESDEFKQYFSYVGEEKLKTAPSGFDKNWEYIEYLRPKDFSVWHRLTDREITSANGIQSLLPIITQAKRLNDFINFTLEENPELANLRHEGRH